MCVRVFVYVVCVRVFVYVCLCACVWGGGVGGVVGVWGFVCMGVNLVFSCPG